MSLRITQSMTARSTLDAIQRNAAQLSETQRRMSTGKVVGRPSDDPIALARALKLRTEQSNVQQLQRNVAEADGWLRVADSAMDKMTDVVQRARELVIAGGTDTAGAQARGAMADEIDQLVAALKSEANATYGGRYVFGGDRTDTRPYDPTGGDAYGGTTNPVAREIGPGVAVVVTTFGQDLLGNGQVPGDGLLLDTLRDVAEDLRAGNGQDLRGDDLRALDANLSNLLTHRAQVGALQKRLEAADSRLLETEEAVMRLLSETEDADMAETYITFTTQQSVYQSALKAGANIVQASLLDYLR